MLSATCGADRLLWTIFLFDVRDAGSGHTVRAYRRALERHPGEDCSLSVLQSALDAIVSPSVRHAFACCWRSYGLWTLRMGVRDVSAATALRAVQPPRKVERDLATDDLQKLYGAADRKPVELGILDCLFGFGMRAGEISRAQLVDGGRRLAWVAKGRKFRNEPVPEGLEVGPALGLSYRQVYRRIRRLARSVGLPVSPHWLRHSHASEAYRNGADLLEISASLGHSNVRTTLLYLHGRKSPASIAAGLVARRKNPA